MTRKISILVISSPLGLFIKIFIADDNYSLLNSENLPQPFQIVLSKTLKTFSNILFNFRNRHQLKHFETRLNLVLCAFWKLKIVKGMVTQISKEPHFIAPHNSQHFRGSETLVKSAWHHVYHIFWLLLV